MKPGEDQKADIETIGSDPLFRAAFSGSCDKDVGDSEPSSSQYGIIS